MTTFEKKPVGLMMRTTTIDERVAEVMRLKVVADEATSVRADAQTREKNAIEAHRIAKDALQKELIRLGVIDEYEDY